jgi:predicted nucleic acid-binding protein
VAQGARRSELASVTTWVVDTGRLVAYVDAGDPAHAHVTARWDAFSGRLATTSDVITEAMHFVSGSREGPRTLADLVAASEMDVFDLSAPPELHEAVALMEKYADTPMDFADATLVLLAEALDAREVLTLDRRGFAAYRTRKGRAMRLVLDAG